MFVIAHRVSKSRIVLGKSMPSIGETNYSTSGGGLVANGEDL